MEYKKGDKVEMIKMDNDPHPIEPGQKGVVVHVQKLTNTETQVMIEWENGRKLAALLPQDEIKKI